MARYAVLGIILFLGLITVFAYKFGKESYKLLPIEEQPESVNIEVYNLQNWHEYSSPHGNFKVLIPTLPQHATETQIDPQTKEPRIYNMYVSENLDGTIFMITTITFPNLSANANNEKIMRKLMHDMMSTSSDNELRTMEQGKYEGYQSLDFSYNNEQLHVNAKTFMVGNTLYVLSRVIKTEKFDINEYNFFVNSFELIP